MPAASAPIPRNVSCPCGSGRKYKLCCGTTRDTERALLRQTEALLGAATLPTLFPLLRPDCKKFDAWAADVVACGLDLEDAPPRLLDEGMAALSRGESERIVCWVSEWIPLAWRSLLRDASEEPLVDALLSGAVAVALAERLSLDHDSLALLEERSEPLAPAEALSLVIDPYDLWSPIEAQVAEEAVSLVPDDLEDDVWDLVYDGAIAAQARHLTTPRHRKRLVRLVGYVRAHLPVADYARASATLADACDAFQRDRALRNRVAALLLEEAL